MRATLPRPARRPAAPPLPSGVPEAIQREAIERLLLDVPLTRGLVDTRRRLAALARAVLCFPVFAGAESPVDGWLAEALPLAESLARGDGERDEAGDGETLAMLRVRAAACRMRRLDLDGALEALNALPAEPPSRAALFAAITRCRVHIRRREFEAARQAWGAASSLPVAAADELSAGLALAGAELALESEIQPLPAIAARFRAALKRLSIDQFEDRVQALQALGFIAITQRQPPLAHAWLAQAREALRAAGAWNEVVPMNIACASMLALMGRGDEADALLLEARAIDETRLAGAWAALCGLCLARHAAAGGDWRAALARAAQGARSFARQGNGLGFAAALAFAASACEAAGEPAESYRVLTLGIGIARALKAGWMEPFLAARLAHLRDALGAPAFDRLAAGLLAEARDKAARRANDTAGDPANGQAPSTAPVTSGEST